MIRGRHLAVLAALVLACAVPATSGAWTATIGEPSNAATTAPYFACADAYAADKANAVFQWQLGEAASATQAADASGAGDPGNYVGTATAVDTADPIACPAGGGSARRFNGTDDVVQESAANTAAPNVFTSEVWFKTTTSSTWLIGFGEYRFTTASTSTTASTYRDRVLYIDKNGAVEFALYTSSGLVGLTSTTNVADGRWHTAAATMGGGTVALWVDGVKVQTRTGVTAGIAYNGSWHVGFDTVGSTGGVSLNVAANANGHFAGSMRWAAAYRTALSDAELRSHFAAGSPAAAR